MTAPLRRWMAAGPRPSMSQVQIAGIESEGGQGVGMDMLKLLAWTAVIVGVLLLPRSRKLERKRERSAGPAALGAPTASLAEQS